ncbi:hypothetical protein BU23DRAFT_556487 [Bimuria novae-zelandiae CBS 107.79]|uniref:Transcription factor Iwr1 domain-containing protein n=1 Tax=Bimuria novae-zelandiae CBS 107.79 TaxID=1447943 RepID=A0A6A5V162_9PLEO|nr:hypothetical protein BU23DRAFT_556487 [Bimuria novae-zelandiae CBS 107.79]
MPSLRRSASGLWRCSRRCLGRTAGSLLPSVVHPARKETTLITRSCWPITARNMVPQPPQTLSVKRKRDAAPVHHLVVDAEPTVKRQKSEPRFKWRLLQKPGDDIPAAVPSPTQQNRRFHVLLSGGQRVLVEAPDPTTGAQATAIEEPGNVPSISEVKEPEETIPSCPRKRPGAGAAVRVNPAYKAAAAAEQVTNPSDDQVKRFEAFSQEVEQEELARSKPVKYLPTGPARRKGRSTPQAATLAVRDPDAMDVDDYVIDTYVREEVMEDADGNVPEHEGIIGYIILKDEDEEWWNGEDESDREFDTDEDDENAEDYYANDYPEDELDSDDEFDRDPYQSRYRHGSDDEEYDLENDEEVHSGDEDDEHFRRINAPLQAALLNLPGR